VDYKGLGGPRTEGRDNGLTCLSCKTAPPLARAHCLSTSGGACGQLVESSRSEAYFRTQSLAPAGTLAVPSTCPLKTLSRKSCVTWS